MRKGFREKLLHLESMFMDSIPDTLNSLYTVVFFMYIIYYITKSISSQQFKKIQSLFHTNSQLDFQDAFLRNMFYFIYSIMQMYGMCMVLSCGD